MTCYETVIKKGYENDFVYFILFYFVYIYRYMETLQQVKNGVREREREKKDGFARTWMCVFILQIVNRMTELFEMRHYL